MTLFVFIIRHWHHFEYDLFESFLVLLFKSLEKKLTLVSLTFFRDQEQNRVDGHSHAVRPSGTLVAFDQ